LLVVANHVVQSWQRWTVIEAGIVSTCANGNGRLRRRSSYGFEFRDAFVSCGDRCPCAHEQKEQQHDEST
jgi:hypothetical protein